MRNTEVSCFSYVVFGTNIFATKLLLKFQPYLTGMDALHVVITGKTARVSK